MPLTWNTLFINETTWTLGITDGRAGGEVRTLEVDVESVSFPEQVARAVQAVEELDARTGPLIVGLPSAWCFCATLSGDGLLRRQRRQGLVYRLEEVLPVDAEAVTADFIEHDASIMGVATLNHLVTPLLSVLEEAGLTVAHFCPTALLIHAATKNDFPVDGVTASTDCHLIVSNVATVDLIASENGRTTDWRSVQAEAGAIQAELESIFTGPEHQPVISVRGISESLTAELAAQGVTLQEDATSHNSVETLERTTRYTAQLLRQGQPPVVDLRRETLSGKGHWQRIAAPATAAMVALLLLALSIGILNTWKTARLERLAQQQTDQQTQLFRETFPGQRVPTAVLSRFRSEALKAKGLTGSDGALPPAATALTDLQQLLAGLPAGASPTDDLRFRVLEIRLEPDRLYLDGQARSHADADRFAAGLRESVTYTIDPPRTQNLPPTPGNAPSNFSTRHNARHNTGGGGDSGGVAFTVVGHRVEDKP